MVITHMHMWWIDIRLMDYCLFRSCVCHWWVWQHFHIQGRKQQTSLDCSVFTFPLLLALVLPGDGRECVPREGPAGGLPHQGQPGPDCVPAGHGASGWEPHRRAGWHPAQPFQKVPAQAKPVHTGKHISLSASSHRHDFLTPIFSLLCSMLKSIMMHVPHRGTLEILQMAQSLLRQ